MEGLNEESSEKAARRKDWIKVSRKPIILENG